MTHGSAHVDVPLELIIELIRLGAVDTRVFEQQVRGSSAAIPVDALLDLQEAVFDARDTLGFDRAYQPTAVGSRVEGLLDRIAKLLA